MAITSTQMKQNLLKARRSSRVTISEEMIPKIKQVLKEGASKKVVCQILGIDYQELKAICR